MFTVGFIKTASRDGWGTVQNLLAELPGGPYKVGDRVAYNCRIKWTNEPDGKHTGGGWDGSDFKEDGVCIGEKGTIVEQKSKRNIIKWDRHSYSKPEWTHGYYDDELKKLPKKDTSEK